MVERGNQHIKFFTSSCEPCELVVQANIATIKNLYPHVYFSLSCSCHAVMAVILAK